MCRWRSDIIQKYFIALSNTVSIRKHNRWQFCFWNLFIQQSRHTEFNVNAYWKWNMDADFYSRRENISRSKTHLHKSDLQSNLGQMFWRIYKNHFYQFTEHNLPTLAHWCINASISLIAIVLYLSMLACSVKIS